MKYTDGNTDGIKRRQKYRNCAKKNWKPLPRLDIEPKIRNKFFEKSAPYKRHFFSKPNYASPQTTK